MSVIDWVAVVSAALGAPAAIYGIFQAWLDAPIIRDDLSDRFVKKQTYRIRATSIKVLIDENQTELIKLRKIRVQHKREALELDEIPKVFLSDADVGRPANIQDLYSLPGTAEETPENRIHITLRDDEAFLPRRDHTVVVGYTMTEALDVLWSPPLLQAVPPVGSERLVMEVHFPQGWRLKRDRNNIPSKLRVFTIDANRLQSDLPVKPKDYQYDFGDRRGKVDWIRAVIQKPPENGNKEVYLEWEWEKKPNPPSVSTT